MTPFSDEDFPTLETCDTYALWITLWFTLSFGCPHTVLGRCSWPHHPTIMYHLSITSPDVSFLHAISGLFDYIFLTLYVGGWVGGLLMAGTQEGLLSLASYTVTFEWLPSVMKIFQPWKHLTHMHCESPGDSLFLSVAHIRSWEDVVDPPTQLLRTICLLSHLMSLSYMPSVVWSIISSWHYVGGWVGGLLMAGTPEGLLSSASYTVTFELLLSVMKIFQPWKHLTRMHCESHGDSLFLSVAHIRPWEYIANQTPNLLMIPFSTRYIWHGGGWLYISDTVCGWVSGRVYLWHPVRGYFLQHSFCHPMQGLL